MASRLPSSILSNIANYLITRDRLESAIVCKSWKTPFQDSLWKEIILTSNSQIAEICDRSNVRHRIYQKNGHLVRRLYSGWYISIQDSQLYILQRYFQRLTHLHIQGDTLSRENFGREADWGLWNRLEEFEISAPRLGTGNDIEYLFGIIAFFPGLKKFTMTESFCQNNEGYSWRDMERIHSLLLNLSEFHIDVPLEEISAEDVKLFESVVVPTKITNLTIAAQNIRFEWIYYLSLKYQNIHTLTWNNSIEKESASYEIRSEARKIVCEFNTIFPNLRHACFEGNGSRADSEHLSIRQTLAHGGVHFKSLYYNVRWDFDKPELVEKFFIDCLYYFTATIERFTLICTNSFSDVCKLPMSIIRCPVLTSLNLILPESFIAFDHLLDQCVSLNDLKLSLWSIFISPDASLFPPEHGIKSIFFIEARSTPQLFNYISLRCRSLESMRLDGLKVIGHLDKLTGILRLDMSHTRLEFLLLSCIRFYSLPPDCEDNEFMDENTVMINLLAIEQTGPIHSFDFHSKMCIPTSQSSTPLLPSSLQAWFHYYLGNTPNGPSGMVQRLNPKQSKHAQKYFRSFQRKNDSPLSHSGITRGDYEWGPKRMWKNDLQRGCAKWYFDSVDRYRIKGFEENTEHTSYNMSKVKTSDY
ncbi:hypothetical protein CLU79DRAFT_756906 [Phycomyces nitens]|nr:hypothetical protein CLU79DRAFT_756906 [Phycomyces nitens]